MALLLETTLGDLVIDLDIEGSPEICKNVLKLAKARYYTSTLVYNVQPNRFCQLGDPQGDGAGGACIYGLISTVLESEDRKLDNEKILRSQQRFMKSSKGRPLTADECKEKGRVVACEMRGIPDTIGSQLLITTCTGVDMALDGYRANTSASARNSDDEKPLFRSVGKVREDENNVLDQIASTYCDAEGRPYADIRVIRALIVDDPFEDPPGMDELLKERGVIFDSVDEKVTASPDYERPPEEKVEIRIGADQVDPLTGEDDIEKMRQQEEALLKREDKSRAVVLEMLGDLPDADIKAPENVLFVCKLNPVTEDEDLELIFARFDEQVKAEIIRDQDTGSSLQYAFIEFTTKEQAVEAYFKMNNALVDDRRIKVDFSQSVAKVWNKFSQRMRNPAGKRSNLDMPRDPLADSRQQGRPGQRRNVPHHPSGPRRNDPYAHRGQGRGREERYRNQGTEDRRPGRHVDSRSNFHRSKNDNNNELDQFGRRRQPQSQGIPHDSGRHRGGESDFHRDKIRRYHGDEDSDRNRRDTHREERYACRSRSRSHDRREKKHRKSHKHKKRRHHRDRSYDRSSGGETDSSADRGRKRSRRHDSDDEKHDKDYARRKRSRDHHKNDGDKRESEKHRHRDRHDGSQRHREERKDRHRERSSRDKKDRHRDDRRERKKDRSRND